MLFLTARDSVADRVAGIRAGRDDYVTKPFSMEEVSARLRGLVRRAGLTDADAEAEAAITVGDLVMTGRLDRPAIRDLIAQHDVYVAPARLESFGIAALEARCGGLPVLAQAAGGVRDFITDRVDGFLASTDDEMADRIVELACAPALLSRLHEHAVSVVPGIDWSSTLDGYERLYMRAGASATAVPTP